jgi:hypothetical protein
MRFVNEINNGRAGGNDRGSGCDHRGTGRDHRGSRHNGSTSRDHRGSRHNGSTSRDHCGTGSGSTGRSALYRLGRSGRWSQHD